MVVPPQVQVAEPSERAREERRQTIGLMISEEGEEEEEEEEVEKKDERRRTTAGLS